MADLFFSILVAFCIVKLPSFLADAAMVHSRFHKRDYYAIEVTTLELDGPTTTLLPATIPSAEGVQPQIPQTAPQVTPSTLMVEYVTQCFIVPSPATYEPQSTITPPPDISAAQTIPQTACTIYSPCNIFFQVIHHPVIEGH